MTKNGVRIAPQGKQARMLYLLGLILSLVIPRKIVFCAYEHPKLRRINVLPECVTGLASISKPEHTANTGDVKIIKPVVLLHSKNG